MPAPVPRMHRTGISHTQPAILIAETVCTHLAIQRLPHPFSAEICQWSGAVFGILFGLGFFLAEVQKNDLKSLSWWKPISALVAGAAVSAHGNNVANNKRTAELTALLVRSTNSASELPIAKSSEYSDLLEDSDNQ